MRVKSYEQILETLDPSAFNRGLSFDAELVPYCGKVFRVRTRIERFIDEKTGKMLKMKTPAVILHGAYCQSLYSGKRILCSRAGFSWWREIWLERVSESGIVQPGPEKGSGHTGRPEMVAGTPVTRSLHRKLSGIKRLSETIGRTTFHATQAREAHKGLVIEPVLFAL